MRTNVAYHVQQIELHQKPFLCAEFENAPAETIYGFGIFKVYRDCTVVCPLIMHYDGTLIPAQSIDGFKGTSLNI